MTAVLGILNKHAVAIAADSAATLSGSKGRKISNTANKIFKLSQLHPVGVAIYSSSSYMRTPWEIIVNSYRKKHISTSFPLLQDYVVDFIKYLKEDFCPSQEDERWVLNMLCGTVWNNIEPNAINDNGGLTTSNVDSFVVMLEKIMEQHIAELEKGGKYDSFADYTIEMFKKEYGAIIERFYQIILKERSLLQGHIEKSSFLSLLQKLIYLLIISPNKIQESTGLVFVGYGEDEYFPSMVSIDVAFAFASRMRCLMLNKDTITKDADAAIYPFAQHDVIDTIIQGIEPSLERQYVNNCYGALKQMQEAIANKIQSFDATLSDQVRNMNVKPIMQNLSAANDSIKKRKYIDPLLETVGSFSKEELANMAESMIALTSLKRKMTFDEESVGGPVDVAVISKSDGFVWIHRKHYFEKEMNIDYLLNKLKCYDHE